MSKTTKGGDEAKKLLLLAGLFLFMVAIAAAWKLGLFTAAAKPLVEKTLEESEGAATESQQSEGHFEVVFKDGTRIKAKKVSDSNTGYWNIVTDKGQIMAAKKTEVEAIATGLQPEAPGTR